MTEVKICGISEPHSLEVAIKAGARFIGFVFYPPSPRAISFETAYQLARTVPTGVRSVGLFVNPADDFLDYTLGGIGLDMIQLHGDEPPERVAAIKSRYNIDVMKAIRVAGPEDLKILENFEDVADWILFDSKPAQADLPGGTGESFDWNILSGRHFKKPWMLGGGLDVSNVTQALSTLNPNAIDVSSGVEKARGVKDPNKINAFIQAVKKA